MAWNSVYRLTWYDLKGYTIKTELQTEDYSGGITDLVLDGDSPVVIQDTLKNSIYTKGCKLNVLNTLDDLFEFANIHKEDYGSYRLYVEQNNAGFDAVQLFRGFLIDDIFRQKLQANEPITLAFNNGLAHLDRHYPAFLEDDDVYFSEMEIIEQCLAFANPENNILINSTLYEDSMSSAEQADNPLLSSYLNRRAFIKDDGDFDNASKILNDILESYNAILYEKEQQFIIERNIDRDKTSKTFWRYTPANSNPYDSVVVGSITPINLDPEVVKRDAMNYTLVPAAKYIKVQLMYDKFNNMIINYWSNLINYSGFLPTVMDRWHYTGTYILVDSLDFSNDFITQGWQFRKQTSETVEDFTDYAHFSYFTRFTKDPDDETVLKFNFKQWISMWPDSYLNFRFYIHLDDGALARYAYWDEDTELWSLEIAPGQINVFANNEEETQHEWNCSKEIDLTGLLSTWADHIQVKVVVRVTTVETGFLGSPEGIGGAMGDFELKTNLPDPDNLIEADLNIAKNKIISKKLHLFDTLSWNYENSKYRIDADGFPQVTESWSDDVITAETLQNHFITNLGNFYNQPRSAFTLEIITRLIQVDDLFETALLQDENSDDIKLTIEQMTHDVKQNTFTVKLVEYISDIGKRIGLIP